MSARRKIRLSAREKNYMRAIGTDALELRYDYERRLRNALLCLAKSDPQWMMWLYENFKPRQCIGMTELLMIEARARCLVLSGYGIYKDRQHIGWLLFRHDWPFTDNGSLSAG